LRSQIEAPLRRERSRGAQGLAARRRSIAFRVRRGERFPSAWSLFASLGARIYSGRLDRALATGADATSGVLLARRAVQLTSWRARAKSADVLEVHLSGARRPSPGFSAAIPVCRGEVLRARRELRPLIEHLRSADAVRAQGMARIQRLLTDGTSPLYADSPRGTLAQVLAGATECLTDEY